ncbi:MAG: hypothetical protein GVY29_10295 [Spirochaetes bacterium]|nr:hypothetical protein [Spirochaetota bacterium]
MRRGSLITGLGPGHYLRRLATFVFAASVLMLSGFIAYGVGILGYRFPEPYLLTSSAQLSVSLTAFILVLQRRVVSAIQVFTVLIFITLIVEPLVVGSETLGFSILLIAPVMIALLVAMGLVFPRRVIFAALISACIVLALVFLVRPSSGAFVVIDLEGAGPLLVVTTLAAGGGILVWDDVVTRLLENTRNSELEARKLAESRETLIRESNHRVKNNLQVISSMLNLQIDEADSPSTADILADARNRIDALALVHRSLQDSLHLDRAEAARFLEDIVHSIVAGIGPERGRIDAQVTAPEIELPAHLLVAVGLIVNELVTNAVVHGLTPQGGGEVTVRLSKEAETHLVLSIHDTGVGIPAASVDARAGSLGLTLVRTIARDQLSGDLTVSAPEGGGTLAEIVIPVE